MNDTKKTAKRLYDAARREANRDQMNALARMKYAQSKGGHVRQPQMVAAGSTFGRLTVTERSGNLGRAVAWACVCQCGTKVVVRAQSLRSGNTKSCGCFRRERLAELGRTHGKTLTRAYNSWSGMVARCTNQNDKRYPLYGGRGIKVCDRWMKAANFLDDMGEAPAGMSIDRIDVNGNYEPSNCRWATQKEQTRNTRRTKYLEINGERRPMAEWCESAGVAYSLVRDRLARGWDASRALAEPKA